MQTPSAGNEFDRGRYPTVGRAKWVPSTRQALVESALQCFARALTAGLDQDVRPEDLYTSDKAFRELRACVAAYASGLYALGQSETAVVGLILVAAVEAAGSTEVHPAIVEAIAQWCREAHPADVNTKPPVA